MSSLVSPLLEVKNLAVTFGQGTSAVEAVKGISFSIPKGETFALVGESGSGKSVTAHSILKLLPYPHAYHPSGKIQFKNRDLLNVSIKEMQAIRGNLIGMIFQEPMTALNPLHTVGQQIAEPLMIHRGMSKVQCRERVLDLLELVGLGKHQDRLNAYPHQLSGGQRQRVMIAMALACEPELLIADEPTTALDVTIQAQILELLQSLQAQLGLTMLMITHNLQIVRQFAQKVAVMRFGEIVETGKVAEVFYSPQHPYTRELLASEPAGDPVAIDLGGQIAVEVKSLEVTFPKAQTVWEWLRREQPIFKAVESVGFSLEAGQTLGIVGESGSGKTSLAMAISRLLKSEGKILIEGQEIQSLNTKNLKNLRKHLQIVFQDPFGSLSPRLVVEQIIGEGLDIHFPSLSHEEKQALIIKVMEDVKLDPETRYRYPHEFSGGQRQRISIARALVLKPSVLILDEPTSALDRSVQSEILDLLRELQQRHRLTYVFISHDLKVVRAIAHKVLVMKDGQVVEEGPTKRVFKSPSHHYTKALMKAAFFSGSPYKKDSCIK